DFSSSSFTTASYPLSLHDALPIFSDLGINNFSKFKPNMAKQFVAVNHEGYLIGDAILVYLEDGLFDLIGWHMVIDWVQYHGEKRSEEHTSELQSRFDLVCRLLLEK